MRCSGGSHARKQVPKPLRRGFDPLFFLIGWMLWKERNSRTFNGKVQSPAQLMTAIIDEASLWCVSGFKHPRSLLPSLRVVMISNGCM